MVHDNMIHGSYFLYVIMGRFTKPYLVTGGYLDQLELFDLLPKEKCRHMQAI